MKIKLKELLREALGVPENITNIAKYVYTSFINELNIPNDVDVDDLHEYQDVMVLKGDFRIADYKFNKIKLKYNFILSDNVAKPMIYGMSHNYKSRLTPNMTSQHEDKFDTVSLTVRIALNKDNTVSDLYKELNDNRNRILSSFAHELKHAYDSFKKPETKINKRAEYEVASDIRFGIEPIDKFIHNLYFINAIEGLVRPSEIAMSMEGLGITKENFIEFLANNDTYKNLKEINAFNMDNFRQELLANKERIIDVFNNANITIPNSDEALIDEVLDLTFKNLRNSKITNLIDTLRINDPIAQLLGGVHPKANEFINNYIKKSHKFKNFHEYFAYEEKMFKFVSENMIKKINKLYAMAKEDPNVSALMQKINDKQTTNESILDWDLHYEAEKIPVTKFKKDLE